MRTARSSAPPTTTPSGGSFECTFPDGPNTTHRAIKVTDSDGASDAASQSVQVVDGRERGAEVTAAADQSSNEGESHSFNLGSFTDPGADSPWTVRRLGRQLPADDLHRRVDGHARRESHTYADGPNDYTVTVTVNDGDATTRKTFSVHVNNVAPTIAISGAARVNEGSPYSLTLARSPILAATPSPATSSTGATARPAPTARTASAPHLRRRPDDLLGHGRPHDRTAPSATGPTPQTVTVNNVAPSIAISGATTRQRGLALQLTLGSVTDPGTDTVSQLRRPLGRREHRHLHDRRREERTPTPTARTLLGHGRSVDRTAPSDRANALSVHVNNVAPTVDLHRAPRYRERG